MSVMSTYWAELWPAGFEEELCPSCFWGFSKQIIHEFRGQLTLFLSETHEERTGVVSTPRNSNAYIHQAARCSVDALGCVLFYSVTSVSIGSLMHWPVKFVALYDVFHGSPFVNYFLVLSGIFAQVTSWENQTDVLRKNSKYIASGSQGRNV